MVRRVLLACLLVLAVQSPIAAAAPDRPNAGPETLWEAFPLDPAGKRVATAPSSQEGPASEAVPSLPPSVYEAGDEGSGLPGAALLLLAATAAGLVLLGAQGVVTVRRLHRSERRVRSLLLRQVGPPGPRQRILEYADPPPRHPDIQAQGRVRVRELPAARPLPPPVEWTAIEPPAANDGDSRAA